MIPPTHADLIHLLHAHGHEVFAGGAYDLNLVALRAIPGTVDAFDDLLCCTYLGPGGQWACEVWPCTTDPGRPALENPRRRDGVAVIMPGQHRGAYQLGLHKGAYTALVPTRAIPVWRDNNRDDVVDYWNGSSSSSWGVNVHRASIRALVENVGPWSEGCVVLQDALHLKRLVWLVEQQMDHGHGGRVTLTLIEVPD